MADRFLRVARRWIRVRHPAGGRCVATHTAVSLGSTANHGTYRVLDRHSRFTASVMSVG